MTARRVALALGALVADLVLVGWRGVLLIGEGTPTTVLLGLAVIVLPVVGAWVLWREVQFGIESQQMARELEVEGGCRSTTCPAGRAGDPALRPTPRSRSAGQRRGGARRLALMVRLGIAYDDAGDRRRARQAMRQARRLYRGISSRG